jgi:uncharacterized protein (DUF1810 family)
VAALDRFVEAQEPIWDDVLAELNAGRKTSHWMWFIFPQIAGLGRSETARFYAIADAAEARAYLAHPVLGPRLQEASQALLAHRGRSAEAILGVIDAIKLRSAMTLFDAVAPGGVFAEVLDALYGAARDPETLRRLG